MKRDLARKGQASKVCEGRCEVWREKLWTLARAVRDREVELGMVLEGEEEVVEWRYQWEFGACVLVW